MSLYCKEKSRGTSLFEMMIVIAISSIILVSIGNLIRVGVDYYFYSTAQIEVQRNALLSLSIMTQELTGSTYESVYTENSAPPTLDPNDGLLFASAVNEDGVDTDVAPGHQGYPGDTVRDSGGNLLWINMICYYIGEVDGKKALLRTRERLAGPPFSTNPPDPVALGLNDIAHFKAIVSPVGFMARGITKMKTVEKTDALEITLTAEVKEGRNWLEMDVSTTIVPRN